MAFGSSVSYGLLLRKYSVWVVGTTYDMASHDNAGTLFRYLSGRYDTAGLYSHLALQPGTPSLGISGGLPPFLLRM